MSNTVYTATFDELSFCNSSALAVELVNFTAKLTSAGSVGLGWHTAWELNADHFEVQQSLNNVEQFHPLTSLPAQGNTDSEKRRPFLFTLSKAQLTDHIRAGIAYRQAA